MLSILVRTCFLFLFVVQIFDGAKWIDSSSHTQRIDAENQINLNISHGISIDNMRIVEKDDFNPPEESQ